MEIIKPAKLKKNSTIGIISPASTPSDLTRIEKGVKYFESLGYKVKVGKHVGKLSGYLAGTDDERIEDIHSMFEDKEVKAIFCVRGGYGTPRLLNRINYKLIAKNPKIFVGYSDITALHLAFFKKTGLVTFAGPMVAVDFYDKVSPYTEELFWRLITSTKSGGKIAQPENIKLMNLTEGKAKGKIIGGNLALLTSLLGTKYIPSFKNKILLLEDIGEMPHRLDRMFNHLKLSGAFKSASGIMLGAFTDCEETDKTAPTFSIHEVKNNYFSGLEIPVIDNLQHGHIKNNITIPFGIESKVSEHGLEYLEGAVG